MGKRIKVTILLGIIILIFAYPLGIGYIFMFSEDKMDRAFYDTKWLLLKSNFLNNDKKIQEHLATNFGEAPSYVVMSIFSKWGIENQDAMNRILAGINEPEKNKIMERLVYVYKETGHDPIFLEGQDIY